MSKSIRILLVDQQPSILKVTRLAIEAILRPKKGEFFLSTNSNDALEIIKKEVIHVAIVDLDLGPSSVDGIMLSHKINEINPDLPVMLLTPFETNSIALHTKNLPGIQSICLKLVHAPTFKAELQRLTNGLKLGK